MNYSEWIKTVPESLTADPLWTVEVYRLSLFAADIAWHDVTKLMQDKRTIGHVLHEDTPPYTTDRNSSMPNAAPDPEWTDLLTHVPLP